jgi:hypothetical protein
MTINSSNTVSYHHDVNYYDKYYERCTLVESILLIFFHSAMVFGFFRHLSRYVAVYTIK